MAKKKETQLQIHLRKTGYLQVSFRLMQLLARAVVFGSGNMSKRDWRELEKLAEFEAR